LTHLIDSSSASALFDNMSFGSQKFHQDELFRLRQTYSASLQPSTWRFNPIVPGPVITPTPEHTPQNIKSKIGDNVTNNLHGWEGSSASPFIPPKIQPEVTDTEMTDAPKLNHDVFPTHKAFDPPSFPEAPEYREDSVIIIDDDDVIEMSGTVPSKPGIKAPSNKKARKISGTRFKSWLSNPRPEPSGKATLSTLQLWLQSGPGAHHANHKPSTQIPPQNFVQEPEFQILDKTITERYPVFQKSSPTSQKKPKEDEVVAAEDIASEDIIIDNLRSLIISAPQETPSRQAYKFPNRQKRELGYLTYHNLVLRQGITVELHNGSFLRIESVWTDIQGTATIKGFKLVRDGYWGRRLPDGRLNELVWVNDVDEEQHRAGLESVLHEKEVSEIKRIRKVIFTNQSYKDVSFANELAGTGLTLLTVDEMAVRDNGQLYCRWKSVQVHTRLKTDAEACIALLSEDGAEGIGQLNAFDVRKNWRGGSGPVAGGSKTTYHCVNGPVGGITQQYTLGDCFCGAGGISRGAVQAGLHVAWAFDSDDHAIRTHAQNFRRFGTKSLRMDDASFLRSIEEKGYCADIVHYSPPCQAFSAANNHTNPERDEVNQQALFSLHHLTERLKPRVATVEETAGLKERHQEWFDALINLFTTIGYSIRWKIVRCQSFGIPQSRVRLFLIVAA
jgi:DNA (cytosine-5)-methyltransferase 1